MILVLFVLSIGALGYAVTALGVGTFGRPALVPIAVGTGVVAAISLGLLVTDYVQQSRVERQIMGALPDRGVMPAASLQNLEPRPGATDDLERAVANMEALSDRRAPTSMNAANP